MLRLVEKEYSILEDLQENDNQICDYLASMTHKSDSIRELFDTVIECFKESVNAKLFEMGFSLYAGGYTEEAIDYGLCDGKDIIEHLKSAHILYMQHLLRENLEAIVQNYAIKYINSNNIEITEEEFDNIDLSDIDEDSSLYDIEAIIEEFIEDKANDLLDEIKKEIKSDIEEKISNLRNEKKELIAENDSDNADVIYELSQDIYSLDEAINDLESIDISYLDLNMDNFKNTNMEEVIRNAIKKEFSDL